MLNIYFFLSFAQRKKLILVLFLGWGGGTGDGRVGRGGGQRFSLFSSQMTKIKFYQNSGKQVQYVYFFLIFHPDHTLSDTHTPYYRKLYISIMLLKGKETISISLNCLKSSNSKNISFCSLQNVHCSWCI